jgi:protein SCO1
MESLSMRKRTLPVILVVAAVLLLGGCAQYQWKGTLYEPANAAPEIDGVNWDGSSFKLSELKGKPVLLFFGYTNCPDVCPTTLAEMRVLRQNLGANADKTAFVYVTVDPERDTVARLKEFIPLFDKAFYGIHVNEGELETVKKGYGVYAEKVFKDPSNPAAGYSVDHTARLYLVDPAGRLAASYPYGTDVADIQKDVEHLIK